MKPEVLQKLMRHKSYKTTLGYVNLALPIEEASQNLVAPGPLKAPSTTSAPRPASEPTDDGEAAA